VALGRPERFFYVAAAVLVAAAGLVLVLTSSSTAPRHVDEWYVGSWRVTAPMVAMQEGRLVQQPAASAGVVRVTDGKNGLSVSLKGFPGVSGAVVPGQRTPMEVDFRTPDVGQGAGDWSMAVRSPGNGLLRAYDPATGRWSPWLPLARQ
jgi:hypothetical protein